MLGRRLFGVVLAIALGAGAGMTAMWGTSVAPAGVTPATNIIDTHMTDTVVPAAEKQVLEHNWDPAPVCPVGWVSC